MSGTCTDVISDETEVPKERRGLGGARELEDEHTTESIPATMPKTTNNYTLPFPQQQQCSHHTGCKQLKRFKLGNWLPVTGHCVLYLLDV